MLAPSAPPKLPFHERMAGVDVYLALCDADPRFRAVRAVERVIIGLSEKTRRLDPWRRGLFAASGFTAN